MKITGETNVLGVFGYPVRHTLSPLMQNAAIEALGLNYAYLPFEVKPGDIGDAVRGIRSLGIAGVNVTVPHKEAVIPFLDELTDEAEKIGAVNTIENRNGRLIGHNTDSLGYVMSLREDAGFEPKNKTIIVIGAGGAAMGIITGLLSNDAGEIVIANRTVEKAEKIKANYTKKNKDGNIRIITAPLSCLKDPKILSSVDLIINTTSMGLEGMAPDVDFTSTRPQVLISDISYKPAVTKFLKNAQDADRRTIGGLGMLVYQGALSFETWTSHKAPVDVMKKALLKATSN